MRKFLKLWGLVAATMLGIAVAIFGGAALMCAMGGVWGWQIAVVAWFFVVSLIWVALIYD